MEYQSYNQMIFGILLLLALILFYQSWRNLIKRQLTKFSLDALIMAYVRVIRGRQQLRKAKQLLGEEPQRLRMLGIIAFLGAIAALYQAIDWYLRYLGT